MMGRIDVPHVIFQASGAWSGQGSRTAVESVQLSYPSVVLPAFAARRSCQSVRFSEMRYDWNLKSTTLSYHGRQNGSKRAENGTKSASMKIEQTIDKAQISAQNRSRRFSVAPMMDGGDVRVLSVSCILFG